MFESTIFAHILLGAIQGLTEFLPISSSGHLILAHQLLGTIGNLDLAFDALLHFATASAIVIYFWKDIPLNTKEWEDKEDSSLTHILPF
tara:strand:- start:242 stop:508 length:267 start_codon:yes stop_codon:yes gene_type:complete